MLREETYKLRRLERLHRENELVDRHIMHDWIGRVASVLRRAGDRLQRRCGKEAFKIYNEALDDVDRHIEIFFGDEAPPSNNGQAKRKRRTRR